jgi:NDP-sugar pyrophosphorylase family protein
LKKSDILAIPEYIRTGEDPDSLGDYVDWLSRESAILSFRPHTYWFDIGTPGTLLKANQHFLVHSIPKNANKTTFIEPVSVDSSSVVEESTIGPNVYIGPGVHIVDSVIRNSIIMEQCDIEYIKIENCIIGPGSNIDGKSKKSVPLDGLVFASNSRVSKHK